MVNKKKHLKDFLKMNLLPVDKTYWDFTDFAVIHT